MRLALRAVAKATLSSLVPAVSTATSPIPSSLKVTENMVHPGGFEPPTARFVAEYSIQLSYGCKMAVRRGFEPRMQLLTAYSLSRGAPSASRPPHHTRLFRVLRRTCFCSSSLRWRTYYFLVLISQTLFRDLFSFAHFARNSRAKTAKRAIYQQEISPDAGITPNDQSGKG